MPLIFYYLLLTMALSALVLRQRYRTGLLITPASGLHLQIFLFFGVGGLAFVSTEIPGQMQTTDSIYFSEQVIIPFLIGYVIVVLFSLAKLRKLRSVYDEVKWLPTSAELASLALLGTGGDLLASAASGTPLASVGTYMSLMFYPCALHSVYCLFPPRYMTSRYNVATRVVAVSILLTGLFLAFFSVWRSMLVLLSVSIMLGVSLTRPRYILGVSLAGAALFLILIPFQQLKKTDIDTFRQNPWGMLSQAIDIPFDERIDIVMQFLAQRISYLREAAYVARAVEGGYPLWEGESYAAILYQIVPRALWPEKPELAKRSGFDLPREVGLLSRSDEGTSWAVNLFAEATYNYGAWCLVLFVPLVFALTPLLNWVIRTIYKTQRAVSLANSALFFLLLSAVTVIFTSTYIIGLIFVLKIYDMVLTSKYDMTVWRR